MICKSLETERRELKAALSETWNWTWTWTWAGTWIRT